MVMVMILTTIMSAGMPVYAASIPDSYNFDISEGNITISKGTGDNTLKVTYGNSQTITDEFQNTQQITITGTTTNNKVVAESDVIAKVALSDVNITNTTNSAIALDNNANVTFTLMGSNTLKSGENKAGISVPEGTTINIVGTGSLDVTGGKCAAGIGGGSNTTGGSINIKDGTIIATSGSFGAGIGGGNGGEGGTITIEGGIVTAKSSNCGAGIGGGNQKSGGTINIKGGIITATAGDYGAGIGGGYRGAGGTITIENGTINATGGAYGAGIGGGTDAAGGTINIKGGIVNATGGLRAAGIGGGNLASGGTLTIEDGTVTATGGAFGAGIGGGISGAGGVVIINNGTVTVNAGMYGSGIGGGCGGGSYPDGAGATLTINESAIVKAASGGTSLPALHTISGSLEAGSTAKILMTSFTDKQSANVTTEVYSNSSKCLSFTPTIQYQSVAFAGLENKTYQLKVNGKLQSHSGSTDYVINGNGISTFPGTALAPILNSEINPVTVNFNKNVSAANKVDIPVTMTLNGNTLSSIKDGTTTLNAGTDYEVNESTVTIKKAYLDTLDLGTKQLTFKFSGGADKSLTIAVTPFVGGDGTEEHPYQIETAEQLSNIGKFSMDASYRQNNFILNNDIDLNVAPYNTGSGWTPISRFRGKLNGNGKIIKNLMINRPDSDNVGLFNQVYSGGYVINLGITNAQVTGKNNVGILIGFMTEMHVEKVFVSGVVNGALQVGGLVGNVDNAARTIINCYSRANVSGSGMVGGLVGTITSSRIENSYAAGEVTLVNPSNDPYYGDHGNLIALYKDFIGGLVGANNPYSDEYGVNVLKSIYYDNNVSKQNDDGKGTKKSSADMKIKSTFTDWDFDTIWDINPNINDGYPHFKIFAPAASNACDIITWNTPSDPTVNNLTATKTVATETSSMTVSVTTSDNSTWKLFSDVVCTQEIANNLMNLKVGENTVYIQVTAQDGITKKIYTLIVTRKAQETSTNPTQSSGKGSDRNPSTGTNTVIGKVIDKDGNSVKGVDARVSTESNGNKTVETTAKEAILVKQPDGTKAPLSDISKLSLQSKDNANVSISSDGTIKVKDLAKGTETKVSICCDLGNGQKIVIGTIVVKVGSNGDVSLTSTLIDPYGTITDAATGKAIEGATVKLYYANTERNKAAGKIADTLVQLPIINGFKPNDNKNPQMSDINGAYGFMVFPTADYYIVATKDGYSEFKSPTIPVEQDIVKLDIKMNKPSTGLNRLSGLNRIDTAIEIAKASYAGKVSNVILASSDCYADALTGSVLAYKLNAPILLIGSSEAEQEKVLSYMKSNLDTAGNVYILGGTGVVTSIFEAKIGTNGFKNITRLGGANRYETSLKIAERLDTKIGAPVVLAYGEDYPDALSISSIASVMQYPILLVEKDKISDSIKSKLTQIKPIRVYIIGLQGGVSSAAEEQVAQATSLGKGNIVRIGGADRYETSIAVAKYFNLTGENVCIATGESYPDAIAGSVYSANLNSPMILVGKNLSDNAINYLKTRKITGAKIFGGEAVVSKEIEKKISELIVK